MMGDIESRFCDYGGLGMLHELDPAQYYCGANMEGLRNIANDPAYIEKENKAAYEAYKGIKERIYNGAIYSIKQQPFYT